MFQTTNKLPIISLKFMPPPSGSSFLTLKLLVARPLEYGLNMGYPLATQKNGNGKFLIWLVVYLPLWKIWVHQLGLLFPTGWIQMFQTTNQLCIDDVLIKTYKNHPIYRISPGFIIAMFDWREPYKSPKNSTNSMDPNVIVDSTLWLFNIAMENHHVQ